jgi:quinol monooxygenase YgiN
MIHVLATIEIAEGKRDAFLAEFHQLVPLVRGEAGCIEYGPAIDAETGLPMQQLCGANAVMVIEKWASLEALKAHLQAAHMITYRTKVKDLVRGTKLQILKPA